MVRSSMGFVAVCACTGLVSLVALATEGQPRPGVADPRPAEPTGALPADPAGPGQAATLLAGLDAARAAAGLGPLRRSAELDRVTAAYAQGRLRSTTTEAGAEPPHTLTDLLRDSRLAGYRWVWPRIAYGTTGSATRQLAGWERITDPRVDGVGIHVVETGADRLEAVMLLLDGNLDPLDAQAMAEALVAAINDIRVGRDLQPLTAIDPAGLPAGSLGDIVSQAARQHSESMAREQGLALGGAAGGVDLAAALGKPFDRGAIGGTLARIGGAEDPVAAVVGQWMDSRSHREQILGQRHTHTAVAVALDDDGAVYVTQLFVRAERGIDKDPAEDYRKLAEQLRQCLGPSGF